MDISQQKEFVASGWEIGAHSLSHMDLTQIEDKESFNEIIQSKTNLEEKLNTNIISFAYPFGKLSESVKNNVKISGYKYALATDSGGSMIEDDVFQIFRVNIFPQDGIMQLLKKTSPFYRRYYRFKRKK